jgi:hypothetical protein
MRPAKIGGFTNIMRKPDKWNHKIPCEDLYVRAVRSADGMPTVTSAWLPSKEELEQLNNGCPVLVSIITTQPLHPMSINVGTVIDLLPAAGLPGGPKLVIPKKDHN